MRRSVRLPLGAVALVVFLCGLSAAQQSDLSEYRTPEKAIAAKIEKTAGTPLAVRPFLGVQAAPDANGWLVVREVAADSPAAKAGVRPGDQLLLADGFSPRDDADLAEALGRKFPGEAVRLVLSRQGKRLDLSVKLTALSRPRIQGKPQANLGVRVVRRRSVTV